MKPIEINYRAKSNVADSSCGVCTNFNPNENSETDGNCFGHKVVAEGLCDLYDAATPVVAIQGAGRLQKSA